MADYRPIVPIFMKKEGGASNHPDDNASSDPSPCTIEGKKKVHTNRGVTWSTFKALAKEVGYKADCTTFSNITDALWTQIFKKGFWDRWNLDAMKSNPMAWTVCWWAWGSGHGGAQSQFQKFFEARGVKVKTKAEITAALDELERRNGPKAFEALKVHRLKFYAGLPDASKFLKGWTSSYNKFSEFVAQHAPAAASAGIGGGVILAVAAAGILLIKRLKRRRP